MRHYEHSCLCNSINPSLHICSAERASKKVEVVACLHQTGFKLESLLRLQLRSDTPVLLPREHLDLRLPLAH